ncbi:TBC1 domain family member 7 isoform X2 [Venturia canescens]|nr:TBC1 domain family member 7 isoform X2 [Venturia canescens]
MHRNFLWKILLGVTPVYAESQHFVSAQRRIEFEDLQNALKVAKIMEEGTKPHQVYLTMWLLRTRRAKIDMTAQLETPLFRAMSKIAESLWHVTEGDHEFDRLVDMYWLLSGFLDHVQKFCRDVSRLQECTISLLEREDSGLYKHLVKLEALQSVPFEFWFCSCFAGNISDGSLPKIWDKIAVGAYKILVFVAVVILTTLRRLVFKCNTVEGILDTITNINEETSEVIVNKAIELWQQSGSILGTMSPNTLSIPMNT